MSVVQIRAAGETNTGKVRPHNEDNLYMAQLNGSVGPAHIERYGYLFIVADGVGGNRGGARAAEIAVSRIPAHYYAGQSPDAAANLTAALQATAREIRAEAAANPDRANMICTVVAAVVLGDQVVIAHMGDARAYLIRDGRLRQLTKDHTWVQQQVENGTLTEAEAEAHPERNVITRALGNPTFPEAAVSQMRLSAGDQLLLCSDGLSGMATAAEITAVMAEGGDPALKPSRLIALANRKGGQDNITAVVIQAGKVARKTSALPVALGLMAVAVLGLGAWMVMGRSGADPELPDVLPTAAVEVPADQGVGGGGGGELIAGLPTSTLGSVVSGYPDPAAEETPTATPTQIGVAMATEPSYEIALLSPGKECRAGSSYDVAQKSDGETITFSWRYSGTVQDNEILKIEFGNAAPIQVQRGQSYIAIPISRLGLPNPNQTHYSWAVKHLASDATIKKQSKSFCFLLQELAPNQGPTATHGSSLGQQEPTNAPAPTNPPVTPTNPPATPTPVTPTPVTPEPEDVTIPTPIPTPTP